MRGEVQDMSRGLTMTMGILFILSLIFIGVLGNKIGEEKERADNATKNVQQTVPGELASEATFNPPSLEDVPDGPQGEAILRGHELVDDTSNQLRGDTASANDGQQRVNELSCSSCHAGAGLEEDSSPLVGVAAKYPNYISRNGEIVTLEERVNGCMVRSMNGQPFAEDDEDLDAMVAYLKYISEGIPVGAELPWLGRNDMKEVPIPDVAAGETMFQQSCIACHAQDGAGTGSNTGPALWGEGSFNDGAGIARFSRMAGYIQNNMPKGQEESLTDQEASNLAAFVLSQDRPEWGDHAGDWPGGGAPKDSMTKELRQQIKDGTINWEEILSPNTK